MGNYLVVGNSSGIGSAVSALLMESGHHVIGISRRSAANVSEMHALDVVNDDLPPIEMPLEGIVYCPGSITLKPFGAIRKEQIFNDISVNLYGAVRVLQQYHRNLQMGSNPAVVLFSTVAVAVGMPYHSSIAIAKGGVEGLMKSLASEWAPKVRVNCIAPSLTATPLAENLLNSEQKLANALQKHPLKKIGDPAQIAHLAVMLLGASAAFITGQVIHADGGISAIR
jgi:3-oxoacyl-[acyl-carrier protein] reductase